MGLRKLYLKIFLSFIAVLILTEFLIFGLFALSVGNKFRNIDRSIEAYVDLLAEIVEDRIAADPLRPIGDNETLRTLLYRLGRIYQAKVWISSSDGKPLLQSFEGPPPPDPRVHFDRKVGRGFFSHRPPRDFLLSVDLEREGMNLGRMNLFWERRADEPSIALFGLVLVGIGGFIALLIIPISRFITNPIRELHLSALRIADGDLSHRATIKTVDEIGSLGAAFNQMTGKIERMVKGNKELMANISHELRSPLARIRVAEELIRKKSNGEAGGTMEYLDHIREEVDELDYLIGQILSLSKLDMSEKPFQMEKVSLEAVMVEVLGRMKPSVEKNGIRLKSEMAPGTPLLLADQESMKTALSNLMDNAVKFSPSGGRVEVSIKPEGGGVRIRLTNTSDPIPEDDLKRLFDPFYRGENSRGKTEGTGLGLAVTKRIVEGHGGTIEAKNVGWGLQLSVYLPATQQLANRY